MYIIYETSRQSRFDAQYWMLGAGALGRPRGMVWGGRREESSGWGIHVYLRQIHFDIWQNQYNIVKLNTIKLKKKECKLTTLGNNLVILTELKMGIPQRPINNTPQKDSRKPSNNNNREECVLYPESNYTNMYLSLRTVHLP